MQTKTTGLLILSIVLVISALSCTTDQPATTETGRTDAFLECDRACLENFADQYLDALVAHDPSSVPLAENIKFTENGQELEVGDALWATASENTDYRIYITDPETGQIGYSGIIRENGTPVLISFRLKIVNRQISEIEQIIGRDSSFSGVKSLTKPDPIFAEVLEPSERSSRTDMIAIADSYFKALERMDGTRHVSFADTCNRMENGIQTTNNPKLDGGSDSGFNISALSCAEQFKTGYLRFVTEIRRRHLLVDEERGLAFSVALLDHAGNIKSVTTTDGKTHDISLLSPTTLMGGGFFKIKNGQIHRIYTVLTTVPYGMKPGW